MTRQISSYFAHQESSIKTDDDVGADLLTWPVADVVQWSAFGGHVTKVELLGLNVYLLEKGVDIMVTHNDHFLVVNEEKQK